MKKQGILLALSDKDSYQSMAIRSALEEKGYQVTVAPSHDIAIGAMQTTHFDLVITDQLGVLEKVKERYPETMAILVLATCNKWEPIARAIRSSPDDCLFKPFELKDLEMGVNHCFEKLDHLRRNLHPEAYEPSTNEKIINMIKVMSHDIRGPLISISATLKLLSQGHYGKMDKEILNKIRGLSSKTAGLIGITEEYLARSFSAEVDSETEGEALDLMRDILIPVLKEFYSELKGHHLFIGDSLRAMSGKRIPLRTNRVLLKMVFRNLIKNAIKYGDERGVIALGCEDHGSSYQLHVFNSGRPIPEKYRKKLFTKFMEIENRDNGKDGARGTGLGLYLTKRVLQNLGGYIWYEAREDGSNFIFTLPSRSAYSADPLLTVGAQLGVLSTDKLTN